MRAVGDEPELLRRRLLLYEKAIALRAEGWSLSTIAYSLGIGKRTVDLWLRGGKPKRVWRYQPDLIPTKDLAYVTGFYLGDGQGAGNENKVRFNLGDKEQLERVSSIVAEILGRPPKPCRFDGLFYSVEYDSVALIEFLNTPIGMLIDYFAGFEADFLQGFFDAEGYVSPVINCSKRVLASVVVGVANTELMYLRVSKKLLQKFGVRSQLRMTNRKGGLMMIRGRTWVRRHDVYHLVIRGWSNVASYSASVGFRNSATRSKLRDLTLLQNKPPGDRFSWFMAHYKKEGRRWLRMAKWARNEPRPASRI